MLHLHTLIPVCKKMKMALIIPRFVMKIPAHLWNQMISAILKDEKDRIYDIYDDTVEALKHLTSDPG